MEDRLSDSLVDFCVYLFWLIVEVNLVQSLSRVQLFVTPKTIPFFKQFSPTFMLCLWCWRRLFWTARIPNHLTCLLRNLYAGQEGTVRTVYGTTDWFQIGKGAHQGCILSPCLFNLYAEYIMWTTVLDEAQARIKIAGRNINSLRYTDDTTLMA